MPEKILILADIHGNGPALASVLGAEPDADRILCLGDLADYGPDPGECVRWARGTLAPGDLVAGNHDHLVASPDVVPPPDFPPVAAEVLHHSRAGLTAGDFAFLRSLPTESTVRVGDERWHLVHALPSDPLWGVLPPEARRQRWALEAALAGFPDVLLVGHTHRPFLIEHGTTRIVSPGSVGRPKDGDRRASYAVWEDGRFELRRVAYPWEETAARLSRYFRGPLLDGLVGYLRRGGRNPLGRAA